MKFLRNGGGTYLSYLILGLSILTTSLLCKEAILNKAFAKMRKVFTNDDIAYIEKHVNRNISDIEKVLENGDEAVQEKLTVQLNPILADLFTNAVSDKNAVVLKKNEMETFVNKVLVPNIIPNSFLCAWILIVEVTEKAYQSQKLASKATTLKNLYEEIDYIQFGNSNGQTTRTMNDEGKVMTAQGRIMTMKEFIIGVKLHAPELNESVIRDFAEHRLPSYTFRGSELRYYETVLKSLTAWKSFILNEYCIVTRVMDKGLRELYGDENFKAGVQMCSLTLSRDHFLGCTVKHPFWVFYQKSLADGCTDDFDDILNTYYGGWYYTEQHLKHFHILIQALRQQLELQGKNLVLTYEPFVENSEIGMPQAPVCRYSKRDFNYFFGRWNKTYSAQK